MSINELSVRLLRLLHIALARRLWSEDYASVAASQSPNTGSKPCNFWRSKWQRVGLEFAPPCLLCRCCCCNRPVRAPVIFSASPQIMGTSRTPPCIFPVIYSERSSARPHGAFALCTECIAFDNCAMSNNSNAIVFGVCQTAKLPDEPNGRNATCIKDLSARLRHRVLDGPLIISGKFAQRPHPRYEWTGVAAS